MWWISNSKEQLRYELKTIHLRSKNEVLDCDIILIALMHGNYVQASCFNFFGSFLKNCVHKRTGLIHSTGERS